MTTGGLFLYDREGQRIRPGTLLHSPNGRIYSVQWIDPQTLLLHVRATYGERRRLALTMEDLHEGTWKIWNIVKPVPVPRDKSTLQ